MARSNSISQPAGSSQASHLREECFRRDGNRCAVSGAFNLDESVGRVARGYLDDDDNSLHANTHGFGGLQVAYIIPRALGWRDDADIASVRPKIDVLHKSIFLTPRYIIDSTTFKCSHDTRHVSSRHYGEIQWKRDRSPG